MTTKSLIFSVFALFSTERQSFFWECKRRKKGRQWVQLLSSCWFKDSGKRGGIGRETYSLNRSKVQELALLTFSITALRSQPWFEFICAVCCSELSSESATQHCVPSRNFIFSTEICKHHWNQDRNQDWWAGKKTKPTIYPPDFQHSFAARFSGTVHDNRIRWTDHHSNAVFIISITETACY